MLPVSSAFSSREPLPGEILDPDGVGYRMEGRRFQEAGDLVSAAAAYQKSVITNPSYAEAYNDLGVVWESMGDREKAIQAYETALHLNPELGDAHMNLALLYEDAGDIKQAGEHWSMRIQIGPPEDPWVIKAHEKMVQHGLIKSPPAPPPFVASRTLPPEPVTFQGDRVQAVRRALQAGQDHLEAKRYKLAIQEFQNALALDPTNPQAIRWLREAEQQAYAHEVKESKKYDDAHRGVRDELKGIQKQEEHAPTEPSLLPGSNVVVPKPRTSAPVPAVIKKQPKTTTNVQPLRKVVGSPAAKPPRAPKVKVKKTADQAMEEALIRAQSDVKPVPVKKMKPVVVAVVPEKQPVSVVVAAPKASVVVVQTADKVPSDAISLAKELANQKEQVRQKSFRELSQRATQAMRESRYAEAADLYKQILLLDPDSREAKQGLQRAQKAQSKADKGR